ncbi:MAG: hypothetical protein QF692_01775 [Alphaproteobacteria bacterium]|jgi:hypothetical protein|nr:hypothetical protein [Alphaproteobacteria bacterium]
MNNFVSAHAGFISILLVTAIGVNGIFVDKDILASWYWLLQGFLIAGYLWVEYLRYKKDSLSVEERFKKYLLDFENWEESEENNWHYKLDPSFIFEETGEDVWEVEGGENWVRAATNPRAFVKPMQIRHNHTVISKFVCIYFDEMRYIIPAPKVTGMIGSGEKWYYSLCAEDFDFYLLPILTNRTISEIVETGKFSSRGGRVPVVIFSSEQEKSRFEVFLTQRPIEDNDLTSFPSRPNDPYIKDIDKKVISYSRVVLQRLAEFRELVNE